MDDGGIAENSLISRVRTIPEGHNSEDVMRELIGDRDVVWLNFKEVMDYLYDTLEMDPEIQGIIGYSDGAAIAATLILDEEKRRRETGRPRQIKCAMFVTGWPPMHPEDGVLLADECDVFIDVPTVHVVGANGTVFESASMHYRAHYLWSIRSFQTRRICTIQCLRSRYCDNFRHWQRAYHSTLGTGDPRIRGCGAGAS